LPGKRRKILIAVLAAPVVLLAAALLYLKLGDLGWLQGPLERRVREALGRELSIGGAFEIEVLPSVRVVAEDVTLPNPRWSDEPEMVHVDRLEIGAGLRSLIGRGPVAVRDLRIEGARVRLERDADGRANWELGSGRTATPAIDPGERKVAFRNIELDDVELTYRDPSREEPLRIVVDSLDAAPDDPRTIALKLSGELGRFPVELTGHITTLEGLLAGEPLRHDLEGRIGRLKIAAHGEVADVATLDGPDLTLRVEGPDLEAVTDLFGLPSLGSGSFGLDGRIRPATEGVELALDADLVDLQAEARGRVDRLVNPQRLDLELTVSGADLSAAGALFGWDKLPPGEFEASAELSGDGSRVTLDRLRGRVGEHVASVEGVIRTTAELVEDEVEFEIEGPDLSAFSRMAGAELAPRDYRLTGHLERTAEGIAVRSLIGRVGDVDVQANGIVDAVLRFGGAKLNVRTAGPDLSSIRLLSDLTLPGGPFSLAGDIETREGVVVLDRVEGYAGDTTVSFDGEVFLGNRYAGTELSARAAGNDPEWITSLVGLDKLPARPYDIGGRIRFTEAGTSLDAIYGTYDGTDFELHGRPGDLRARVSGPDLSRLEAFGAPEGLPKEFFEFDGRVRSLDVGYELEDCRARLGSVELELDGRLGELPDIEGSDLRGTVRGPDLSALTAYSEVEPLPAEAFSVAGRWSVESGSHRLRAVSGELGGHRFAVDGTVAPPNDGVGTELDLQISGADLTDARRIAAGFGFADLPSMPGLPYSVAGDLRIEESGYSSSKMTVRVGESEARLSGGFGSLPDGYGTDLTVEARGPDASEIAEIVGVALPAEAFSAHGRIERDRSGMRFRDVVAELGDYHAEVDGTLGEPPTLAGTDLDFRVSGPDPSLISELADLPPLPREPLEVSAHLDGSAERFRVQRLDLRLGRSDVTGELSVDLRGERPHLEGELVSERLDLTPLLADDLEGPQPEPVKGDLLISDEPLDLALLDEIDVDVRWSIAEALDPRAALGNIEVHGRLRDGGLTLGPVKAEGYGGRYLGELSLRPEDGIYRFAATGNAEQARMGLLAYTGDPGEIAPVDLELELSGRGASLHEIASSVNGTLLIAQGPGRIDNSILTRMSADPLSKLYGTLNPFTKEEPYTELQCSVTWVELQDGVARIEPLALRTDKMVVLAKGQIDFETERLKIDWATKPRKGVGLSAGSIANEYVKLGGTLSNPVITVSPLKAAGEAGATVMTAGMWLLYKSVFNRVTAERRVCELALKKIRKKKRRR
jgi:uncharacterized protein involved in outer membrane biogenesis